MDHYAASVLGERFLCIAENDSSVLHIHSLDNLDEICRTELKGLQEDGMGKIYAISGGEDGRSVAIVAGDFKEINSILLYQVTH